MSLSWVWQISLSRGWVMEKGRGQEESEAYPRGTGCSMSDTGTLGASLAAELSSEGKGWGEALSTFPVETLWIARLWG